MKDQIRSVIIDDEQNAVKVLSKFIEEYCPEVNIVGTANSVADGIAAIEKETPNLVFLDIEIELFCHFHEHINFTLHIRVARNETLTIQNLG